MGRGKLWSESVEAHGVRVRIYEREPGGRLYCEVRGAAGKADGKKRKSLGHSDKTRARTEAKIIAKRAAEARLLGREGTELTLGALFRAYRDHRMATLSPSWAQAADTRIQLFLLAWGDDQRVLELGPADVERYSALRRNGSLDPRTPGTRGYRKPRPVRDGTLDADFRWLTSVFHWAEGHKVDGRRLLTENPLRGVAWPKEKNVRRPVASEQRFRRTLAHVDTIDPQGRLGCILQLARHTGRRESAICGLLASDLLLTPDRLLDALARAGMDERLADHMPHGAIRWSHETDKQGMLFVSPLSPEARAAIERYLGVSPRVGHTPLFPAPKDQARPIRRDTAAAWLKRAEQRAGLPKLQGGTFHPYRRLWASERKHHPAVDVAAAGGWKDTRALQLSYQQSDPATVLSVVQNGAD